MSPESEDIIFNKTNSVWIFYFLAGGLWVEHWSFYLLLMEVAKKVKILTQESKYLQIFDGIKQIFKVTYLF